MNDISSTCVLDRNKKRSMNVQRLKDILLMSSLVAFISCQEKPESIFDAAYEGDLASIKQLVEEGGISVNEKDQFQNSVLFHAASGGHLDVVKYIAGQGGDLMETSGDGSTLLHIAAGAGDIELMTFLLEFGIPIDSVDVNGESPLMFSVLGEHKEAALYLVSKGGNAHLKNAKSKTPAQLALRKKWEDKEWNTAPEDSKTQENAPEKIE